MKVQDNRLALAKGSEIGVYEVQECVDGDRLSLAYSAWNHHLNAPVFLREYFPSGLARRCPDGVRIEPESQANRKRFDSGLSVFLGEADRLAELQHRAIGKVLNALEFNGSGYQVMSFEKGQKLSAWIASAYSFKTDQLQLIFAALVGGLKTIHEIGLVHGRVCPDNIILRDDGDPVLISFPGGLFDSVSDQGTLSRLLPEGYAPIEQYQPGHQLDPADDLYALGATLYHCVTDKVPFSSVERLDAVKNGNPDLLGSVSDSMADKAYPWTKAVDWMLQLEVKDRPHSVSQVEAYLANLSREQQISQQGATFRQLRSMWPRKLSARDGLAAAVLVLVILVAMWPQQQHTQVPGRAVNVPDNKPDAIVEERIQMVGNEPVPVVPQSDRLSLEQPVISDQSLFDSARKNSTTVAVSAAGSEPANALPTRSEVEAGNFREIAPAEKSVERGKKLASLQKEEAVLENKAAVVPDSGKISQAEYKASAIAGYLSAAEKNLALFNLTTPEENNAHLNYRAVLDLDPNNAAARLGIRQIEERYTWLIEKAIDKGNLRNARVYLARANQLPGDSSNLAVLRSELEKAR